MPDSRTQNQQRKPTKRPLWPWVVLLVLALSAIYAYDRTALALEQLMRQVPNEILDLFDDFLDRDRQPGTEPATPIGI